MIARDDPEPADVIALVRMHMAGDEDSISALLDLVDERRLYPLTVDFLVGMITGLGLGPAEVDAAFAVVRAERWPR